MKRSRLALFLGVSCLITPFAGCAGGKVRTIFTLEARSTAGSAAAGPLYAAVNRQDGGAGLFRADTPGGAWTEISPPGPTTVVHVRQDPSLQGTVFAIGTAGNESFVVRSPDRGATWTRLQNGLPAAVDATRAVATLEPDLAVPGRLWLGYALATGATGPALFRSDDRGNTWAASAAGLPAASLRQLVQDAVDPQVRVLRTDQDVFRTADAGLTWQAHGQGLPVGPPAPVFLSLVAHPTVAGRLFAIVNARLFRRDALATAWVEQVLNLPEGASPHALAVDPTSPDRLLLATYQGVQESADGGVTWVLRDPALSQADFGGLAFDRTSPSSVTFATYDGLYRSSDGGRTWRRLDERGLPHLSFRAKAV